MDIKTTVGMFADDNIGWTAGTLYIRGIAQSLRELPEPDRPNLQLLISRNRNRRKGNALDNTFGNIVLFDRQPKNPWQALIAAVSQPLTVLENRFRSQRLFCKTKSVVCFPAIPL